MKIIERKTYIDRIRLYYDSQYIKVITGIRRCGKSVILKQIKNEIMAKTSNDHIIYIDLETKLGSTINNRKKLEDFIDKQIFDKDKYYIFIDEIQHLNKFEEALASIRATYNCSMFVTGSNSKLLQGKMQDRLTGRAKEFKIFPFTFSEYLSFKKENNQSIDENCFYDYLKWGGMPQRFEEISENGINDYIKSLFYSIIDKDVYGCHKRINKRAFTSVAEYILGSSGHVFSALNTAKYLKNVLDNPDLKSCSATINNYTNYMSECYFISECLPHFIKGREALKGTRKFYPIDPAFKTAFNKEIELDDTFSLETVLYNELIVRGYKVNYGKLPNGEIDFVASKGNKKCYIQLAYLINSQKVFDREYGAFKNIADGCPKYVFSLDKKDTSNNGITHINIIDYLIHKVDIRLS